MTDRRRARGRAGTGARVTAAGGPPPELQSRLDPFWSDPVGVRAKYGHWFDNFAALLIGSRLYYAVTSRWAIENGYRSATNPSQVDWVGLRRAGVIGESPALLRAEGRAESSGRGRG